MNWLPWRYGWANRSEPESGPKSEPEAEPKPCPAAVMLTTPGGRWQVMMCGLSAGHDGKHERTVTW